MSNQPKNLQLLVIRLSSFGDITQAMGVPEAFQTRFPNSQVDWLVRSDFEGLLKAHPTIRKIFSFDRKTGLLGLWRLSKILAEQRYSHIYDAHNNVRSWFINFFLHIRGEGFSASWITRPKNRWRRWLFFTFRLTVLPTPFRGIVSFHAPLNKWGINSRSSPAPQFYVSQLARQKVATLWEALGKDLSAPIVLVPSAAWEMKRWPLSHWLKLIELLPQFNFVILGGPEDAFCEELRRVDPSRVWNFAGQLSLQESAEFIARACAVVANDTGLLHVADQLGKPTFALIGPTAFGYPTRESSVTLEVSLSCKPCSKDGRGICRNLVYQKCLHDITPERVADALLAKVHPK